jgi:hypothetical protein
MLPRWVMRTVIAATAISFLLVLVGAHQVADYFDADRYARGHWLRTVPVIGVALALVACWAPPSRGPRAVRAAVLLPLVHVAAIVAMIVIWRGVIAQMPYVMREAPLVAKLPFAYVLAGAGAFALAAGRIIAWHRRREWLHASVTFALVMVVATGVWLPVVVNGWAAGDGPWLDWDGVARLATQGQLVVWVLAPPAVIAIVYAALSIHRYERVRSWRGALVGTLAAFVGISALMRMGQGITASLLYGNFIHVILALAIVAASVQGVLAASLWLRQRRERRALAASTLTGVIDGDRGLPVASLQIAGWLRGPRVIASSFTVTTERGAVVVPGGAVACAPPASSMMLDAGEAMPILRAGDRVVLAGFVTPAGDDPFRGASALIPGSGEVYVAAVDQMRGGFDEVALATWRPAIAYLLAMVAVAIPGLTGALAV